MKIKGLWANLPVCRKLYFVVGLMAVLIASELFTLLFAMNTLSSVRAFVAGEGLWSKAQKDAIHSLYQYALLHDEKYYSQFNHLLDVTLGDHLARIELEKKNFDREVVRKGFLQGENHSGDVDGMIDLLVRFKRIGYIHNAVTAWTQGDVLLQELRTIAGKLHRTIQAGGNNSLAIKQALGRIALVNVDLTVQENAFSSSLGEGSRWMERLLMTILVLTVLTVESTGILLTYRFSRALGRRLKELMQTASEVGQGNFSAQAPVVSRDELGQLADALNYMTSRLQKSLSDQIRIEAARRKGEETLAPLINAVEDYAIFILDPSGFVVTWNLGAERIKGYGAVEVIGKHFSIFYPARDIQDHLPQENLEFARTNGRFEAETVRVRKDGSEFYAHVVITPIRNSQGRITGFAKVTRDMTAQVGAENKLRKLNEELEKRVEDRTRSLKRREAQLKLITDAVPVLIAQFDSQERFLFANEAFCSWFRVTRAEISGAPFKEIVSANRYFFAKPHINEVLHGEAVSFEQLSEAGDSKVNLAVTLIPVMDDEEKVSGFILVATDVTPYKKIQDELMKARHGADVASATKSAFLANMSHEIRTPLAAILGFTEIMLEEATSPEKKFNCARVIRSNGRILSNLINDILDLSKVEAGKLEIERLDVSVDEIISEVKSLLIPMAHQKGLTLTVREDETVPKIINTDPLRLRQILVNLVGNAIKFTDKGSINIRLESRTSNGGGQKLAFVIRDTGRGISPEQAQRLFLPFMQADPSTTRKYGGTGLGLVLSKNLAMALGGDLVLGESVLGEGSTFIVTIDLERPLCELREVLPAVHEVHATHKAWGEKLESFKVLLVDDSLDNQFIVSHFLRGIVAEVETASSGKEGIEKAMSGNFSVVLMDIQMPGMDGFAATKKLRQSGFDHPIIALTAHAMKEDRRHCLESGFDDHVTKPIDRRKLIHTIAQFSA